MRYREKRKLLRCRRINWKSCKKAAVNQLKNGVFLTIAVLVLMLNLRYDLFYIKTGSMKPALPVGSIVVADPYAKAKVGDIFAYQAGEKIIIHRIVEINGETYIFRGDANGTNDAAQIKQSQLVGKIILTLNFFAPVVRILEVILRRFA